MSDNLCIDPSIHHNWTSLTCEAAEPVNSPKQAASNAAPPRLDTNVIASPARSTINLRDYIAQINRGASQDSAPLAEHASPHSPILTGLVAMLPVACGDSGSFPSTDAGSSDSGSGGMDAGDGGGTSDGGMDAGGGGTGYLPESPVTHDTIPCGSNGFTTDLDEQVGACANYTDGSHHLFTWNSDVANSAASILALNYAPDQVLQVSSGQYFVTNFGNAGAVPPMAAGLAIIDNSAGSQQQHIFPNLVLSNPASTSAGTSINQLTPTQPKGITEVGDLVFVNTSNGIPNFTEPSESYYNPGTVLIYDRTTGGLIHHLVTTDYNPTSIRYHDGLVYVINSGDINASRDPVANSASSIDIFDPAQLNNPPINIPLGNIGAGINGEIAISSDGNAMVLPTGDNSGRLIIVNLGDNSTREITVVAPSEGQNILLANVSIHSSGRYVYVGNFNDGNLYTVDLDTDTVIDTDTLDADTSDFSGISDGLLIGSQLFIGVGDGIQSLNLATP